MNIYLVCFQANMKHLDLTNVGCNFFLQNIEMFSSTSN